MNVERLKVGGAVVFWRLAKSTNRAAVDEGLKELGLEEFAPEVRSPMSCLRAALADVFLPHDKEERIMVRPHKNSVPGFAVVVERPGDHAIAGDPWGNVRTIAGLDGDDGTVHLCPYDDGQHTAIQLSMAGAAGWLTAASVGKALVGLVEHLGGVALRQNGGVYWLNEDALDLWARIGDLFEAASAKTDSEGKEQPPNRVYVMTVVADEQMVRAVGDALTAEVQTALEQVEIEIQDPDLTPYKCESRLNRAAKLDAKVRRYEEAFGAPLTKLTEACAVVAGHVAMAQLKVSAAANPTPLFTN